MRRATLACGVVSPLSLWRGLPTAPPARPQVSTTPLYIPHPLPLTYPPMETYRIHDDTSVYFVTYSVVSWLPLFVSERACRIVTDSLAFCHAHKGLRVNAYVIMPTHIHAILFDHEHDPARLTAALDAFRRYTGRALADYTPPTAGLGRTAGIPAGYWTQAPAPPPAGLGRTAGIPAGSWTLPATAAPWRTTAPATRPACSSKRSGKQPAPTANAVSGNPRAIPSRSKVHASGNRNSTTSTGTPSEKAWSGIPKTGDSHQPATTRPATTTAKT